MATEKQVRANKENAKRSSGPTSQAGKMRASRNALRHGLSSRAGVLTWEDQAEFDDLHRRLKEEYQPRTTVEGIIVDQLTMNYWRLMRLRNIETALYLYGRDDYGDSLLGSILPYRGSKSYTMELQGLLLKQSLESDEQSIKAENGEEIDRLQELCEIGPAYERSEKLLDNLYSREARIEKTIRSLEEKLDRLKIKKAERTDRDLVVEETTEFLPPRHRKRPPELH